MEPNGSSSNARQNPSSEVSHDTIKQKSIEKEAFENHAEIAWHQRRKEWVGDQSKKLERPPRGSIAKDSPLSLSKSYEDMLLSTEPFPQPIPLAEMVDFLVDIWREEGLCD